MPAKTNKQNLLKLLVFSYILFIILALRVYAGNGDKTNPSEDFTIAPEDIITSKIDGETTEITGVSLTDGYLDVSNSKGSYTFYNDMLLGYGVKEINSKKGIINIEGCIGYIDSVLVEDGSAKITFTKTTTIQRAGETIDFPSLPLTPINVGINGEIFGLSSDKGYAVIEFEDGVFTLSEGAVLTGPDRGKIKSISDGTKIKYESGIPVLVNPKAEISVDYDTSPLQIKLYGTYSSIEINTENNEKFKVENIDEGTELIVSVGAYHKICNGNCVSYVDEGAYEKMKINGNAKTTKYNEGVKIYAIKFENGIAKLGRPTSRQQLLSAYIDLSRNAVFNYNDEDIIFTFYKSEKEVEKIREEIKEAEGKPIELVRIMINGKIGEGVVELTDLSNLEALDYIKELFFRIEEEEKKKTVMGKVVPLDYFDSGGYPKELSRLMKESQGYFVYSNGRKYSIYDLAAQVVEDIDEMAIAIAVFSQESTFGTNPYMNEGDRVGLGQVGYPAFVDVMRKYYSEFSEYSISRYKESHGGSDIGYEDYILDNLKNDPYFNAKVAARYLTVLETEEKFSTLPQILVGYNYGPGNTKDVLNKIGWDSSWEEIRKELLKRGNTESVNYVEKIYENLGQKLT